MRNSGWRLSTFGLTVLLLTSLISTGCSPSQSGQGIVYVPPTPAATRVAPTLTAAATTSSTTRPTPTPPCSDNMVYLSDISIPDGTAVTPGATLDKRWEVENNGSCNWDRSYSLHLVAGQEMGAGEQQALYPARSGTTAIIRILFTAPTETGVYRSAWQAYGPDGEAFGDPIFIEIEVTDSVPDENEG